MCNLPDYHGATVDPDSKGWTEVTKTNPTVELRCKEVPQEGAEKRALKCNGVVLFQGDMQDFGHFGAIRITMQEEQTSLATTPFRIDDFNVEILQRRLHHVYYLTAYKYLFVIAAAVTAYRFYKKVSKTLQMLIS